MDRHAWDRRYAGSELVWSAGPNQFVARELELLPPGRALDLAAGEGRNALWLAERGWDVLAVDFSEVALDKGRRAAESRGVQVDFRQEDLTEWAPDALRYDLVLLAYLQLPWSQMVGVVHRAAAAVAEGGTFLLVGHDLSNLEHGHGGPQDPQVLYTPERVAAELSPLHLVRAECVKRHVTTDDGDRTALDTLVRARRARASSRPSAPNS